MKINEVIDDMIRRGSAQDTSRRETGDAPDALTLLHQDHEMVNGLFERALDEDAPAAQRRSAIAEICEALTVHAKMEESLFYPALRRAGKSEERDSVLEAGEEHGMVKDMVAKIKRSQGRDETLKAKVTVLKEMVQHHVREEESTIFDEARRVMGNKLQALGEEMQRFKERAQRPAARRTAATRTTSPARKTAGGRKSTAKRSESRASTTRRKTTKRR